jgi:streptomycin 6-kinase
MGSTVSQPADPLPEALAATVSEEFRARGGTFLDTLPARLADLAERWSVTLGPPFADLSYHYVCSVTRADGTPAVLKVGVPQNEMRSEMAMLRLCQGSGIARLYESNFRLGGLLMERVSPGTTLVGLAEKDDDASTRVAAGVMRRLWRPAPDSHAFRDLTSWFRYLWHWYERRARAIKLIPAPVFDRAVELARELITSTERPVLLHGDLHHMNILSATESRAGRPEDEWLAIDPKGLVGDAGYEVHAFIVNPKLPDARILARRLDILSDELGMDRSRLRDWCFARVVLNACWNMDRPQKVARDVAIAETFAGL